MFGLLVNVLVRSGLILAAGIAASRLARWRPAQRHGILLSAFALLLLWPLFAALLPEIALPLWKQSFSVGTVTVHQFLAPPFAAPASHAFGFSPLLPWALAAVLALGPLFIAHLRLGRLVRRAVPCHDAACNDLLHQLCLELRVAKAPTLLIHPERVMPMVSGVSRPCIVLPADCGEWLPTRCRIVLLHELAHIVRRDLLVQRCARLIAAAWWFQPLSWYALLLLRRESERACDELVVATGVRPSDYAAELLKIAQAFSSGHHTWAAGMGMAREKGLEGRLHSILQPQYNSSHRSIPVAIFSLTALTFVASAVTLLPESQPTLTRGHFMKHTLFAGLLASAGLSAATIGGSLYDPSGAAVPNAKALLYDPDTNSKFETITSADGKFVFETLPAGQYILRVQSPGFATLFREFKVNDDSKVDRGLTLSLGKMNEHLTVSAEGTPAPSPQPAAQPKPIRVGGTVEESNLIQKMQPVYPKDAKAAGIQGTVTLEMVISKEGEPRDIRVVSSPDDSLTQSALESVRQWRYKPTLLNGNPVEIVTDVVVNYTLAK